MNVSPIDFDGDGCLDVLIAAEPQHNSKTEKNVTVYVYWGNSQTLGMLKLPPFDVPVQCNSDILVGNLWRKYYVYM